MEIIVNHKVKFLFLLKEEKNKLNFILFKTMDKGINVIQLETASGAAIQSFEGAQGDDLL
jgi:hypothetical protein